MRRTPITATLVALTLAISAAPSGAAPRWERRLHKLTRPSTMSIKVAVGPSVVLDKRSGRQRVPASNQKLLLSMALLGRFGPNATFRTRALVSPKPPPFIDAGEPDIEDGVLRSNLWMVGGGDPTFSDLGGGYGGNLSIKPTWVYEFAGRIERAGVKRIAGRVVGAKEFPFRHDWDAPGWKPNFNEEEVALPSALSIDGNVRKDRFTSKPELLAARAVTRVLRKKGIKVGKQARAWRKPSGLTKLTEVTSPRLASLLGHMNRTSSNFFAEVLGKALAVEEMKGPGTIAKGAAALRHWLGRREVGVDSYDSSGLSGGNRVSARGIVRLLKTAEASAWGDELFRSLPKGGWGTLEDRLHDVRLRAKTGTLDGISTLSGWLWLRRSDRWARFSIMSNGMPAWQAKAREDEILRILTRHI